MGARERRRKKRQAVVAARRRQTAAVVSEWLRALRAMRSSGAVMIMDAGDEVSMGPGLVHGSVRLVRMDRLRGEPFDVFWKDDAAFNSPPNATAPG